jgi:hypothetical protein
VKTLIPFLANSGGLGDVAPEPASARGRTREQRIAVLTYHFRKSTMAVLLTSRKTVGYWLLNLALPVLVYGQTNYIPQGNEYPIAGAMVGDQVFPDLTVSSSGGFLVWEDNFTDGDGSGISAQRLDASFSRTLSSFRVNGQGAFDQEKPRVARLADGGAVFVWQGGKPGAQRIYARFLSASNTWVTGDVLVNTFTNSFQLTPVVTALADGNVVVVWSSFNQEATNSLQGVYAQRFSPAGAKVGGEFRVNQATAYNQRTPSVAGLADGRWVVAWVSEQQRFEESVDIYARVFLANGNPAGDEFVVNTTSNLCSRPAVASSANGDFLAAWSERNPANRSNSWDIVARPFSSAGLGGVARVVNTHLYGDQLAPRVSADATDYLVVWTSLGQDGSGDGVYGQFLRGDGLPDGGEFRVNTTTVSQQMHPAVSSDGNGRFLAVWTSFGGGRNSFDLYAQRYATTVQPLPMPDPPYVTVLSSNQLAVTWPLLAGFNVAHYEVYADVATMATAVVTSNSWTAVGLAAGSTHYYRLAFVLADGRRSPISDATTNTTYGSLVYGGIPYDWMAYYFGSDVFSWPAPLVDSDGDGVSNKNEFLAGTDPTDANSVLRMRLQHTAQGLFLNWNSQPGLMYQVQVSTDLGGWVNLGGPRFAAGYLDSMYAGGGSAEYYRVLRLR